MRGARLRGVSRRGFPTTTQREPTHNRPANDPVGRDFRAAGPNRLWVADINYVPTAACFLFLAVDLNVGSRRIVGWAMATDLRMRLVLDALDMAVTTRKPANVAQRSDQGSHGHLDTSGIPGLWRAWGAGGSLGRPGRRGKRCCADLGVAVAAARSGFRIMRAQLACRASTTASCCRPCW